MSDNSNSNLKRPLREISPDFEVFPVKKNCPAALTESSLMDTLLLKMEALLDEKFKDIATKKDLSTLFEHVTELKEENKQLRDEIEKLKTSERTLEKRIEDAEKYSKRLNIIARGLNARCVDEAKQEFQQICSTKLKVSAITNSVRKIGRPNQLPSSYIFELSSLSDVHSVLSSSILLRNSPISINKDLTVNERSENYHLRQVKKCLLKADARLKVEIKRWTLLVDGRRYKCNKDGLITTFNEGDKVFISNLLSKTESEYPVKLAASKNVQEKNKNN